MSKPAPAAAVPAQDTVARNYGKLPLSFEANRGQTDGRVQFVSRGPAYSLFLERDQSVLALGGNQAALHLRLVGANPAAVTGVDELPGRSNYFIGNDPAKWLTGVPNYSRVKYEQAYPGVDLVYYGNQRQLEYDFVVGPGADPRAITLALSSDGKTDSAMARTLHIASNGDLQIRVGREDMAFRKPVVYQEVLDADGRAAKKRFIDGKWVLKGGAQVGFEVAAYDASQTLVIDPMVSFSGYLGGNSTDVGNGVVIDSAGNAYIAGRAQSVNFPTTTGTYQTKNAGGSDAFVSKLNAAGTALLYSTFVGGKAGDIAFGIALDPATDNVYITGATGSTNFPVTTGAFQTVCGGGCATSGTSAVFVTELNSTGSALIYSTYVGGANNDTAIGFGIAVDTAGEAYVTGRTGSTVFPTTPKAFQTALAGNQNAFVVKLNSTGTALAYSTYLGGKATDLAIGIKVDGAGSAYVAGNTSSVNFPATAGAFQTACAGGCTSADAFVAKLTPDGSGLVYSTFLGGTSSDDGTAIAIDSAGDAYVTGFTCSTDFPTTMGAFQRTYGGGTCSNSGGDVFVTKVDPAGAALLYSTYLGGDGQDAAFAIAADAAGNAWVTGSTSSDNFPTTPGAFQSALAGTGDIFVTQVNAAGSALGYSTYLGGTGTEVSFALAVDAAGNPYVTGKTTSTDFPVTPGFVQQTNGGGTSDAFIAKFAPGEQAWPLSLSFGSQAVGTTSPPQTTTLSNSESAALSMTSITIAGPNPGDFSLTQSCGLSLTAGATCPVSVTFTPTTTGSRFASVTFVDSATNSPQNVALVGIGTQNSVTLVPTSLTFSTQLIGTSSAAQKATLNNTGSATVNIATIVATGPFMQTNTCGATLAPAANCAISVVYQPTLIGTQTGAVTVTDDAVGSPQKLTLSGTGTVVSISPTSLSFGTQTVKTSSAPQTLTMKNNGTGSISISKISITGSRVTSFSETNTCPASLAGGASCTISVTFTPQLKGLLTAAVSILDTGGGSPQNTALSGTGQ